jgi:hypothetical protein
MMLDPRKYPHDVLFRVRLLPTLPTRIAAMLRVNGAGLVAAHLLDPGMFHNMHIIVPNLTIDSVWMYPYPPAMYPPNASRPRVKLDKREDTFVNTWMDLLRHYRQHQIAVGEERRLEYAIYQATLAGEAP